MEPKFQTSFIPKTPVSGQRQESVKKPGSFNLFSTLATLLFIATLAAGGGLFFYDRLLQSEISRLKNDISQTRDAFQPQTIQELIDFSKSVRSTNQLLQKHIAVSAMFEDFSNLAIRPIRFVDFSYVNNEGQILVEVNMEGTSYAAFAQQSNIFANQDFIISPEFSGFQLSDTGRITASFTAMVDQSVVSYERKITPEEQTQIIVPPQSLDNVQGTSTQQSTI